MKTIGINKAIILSALFCAFSQVQAVTPGQDLTEGSVALLANRDSKLSQAGKPVCSNRTLTGTYSYQFEGSRDEGRTLTREAGMEVYDGKGSMSVIATFNSIPGGVGSFQTTQLNYVVNPNCTGILSGKSGKYADIFVAPDGSSFNFISNVPGQQISGTETRISRKKLYAN